MAIGASAGGLAAIKVLLAGVPEQSGLAYVVVVHLSPEHDSHLAELLQPHTSMPVRQVTETMALEPDNVFVIPPGANLESVDSHLRLSRLEPDRKERAPIDHFFRTLAETHDGRSIGIVLTGTGSDGTLGLREIKGHGGLAIVQDPNEAEFDGMPRSVVTTGSMDMVLKLAEMPRAIMRFADTSPRIPLPDDDTQIDGEAKSLLAKLFALIRTRTGRDFSRYKRSTVLRRIARRMQFNHIEDFDVYLQLLADQPLEVSALADDLLINVSSFFRDPLVFEHLAE